MSVDVELRVLSGCHAGARAPVLGGERIGADEGCELILSDVGLGPGVGAWLCVAAQQWSLHRAPQDAAAAASRASQDADAWVPSLPWGTVAYLGPLAITVSRVDAPWQTISAGRPSPSAPAQTVAPESGGDEAPGVDTLPGAAVLVPVTDEAGNTSVQAMEQQTDAAPASTSGATAPAHRRWSPFWIIGAALVALLLSVFWSLLGSGSAAVGSVPPPDAVTSPVALGLARQPQLLKDIQLAIARVDPALRLRVDGLPDGGARVSGWVADIAQLDMLAEGLGGIRPVPALSVRTASDLMDDLVDAGGPDAPALRYELLGAGRVRVHGMVVQPDEHARVLAALRSRVPHGIEIVDGLRVASAQGGVLQDWMRAAGFARAEARWDGEQMVVSVDISSQERARLESLLARPGTPLSGIPFTLRAREVGHTPAVTAAAVHASAAPLPFRIRSVVGGVSPYVVLGDGTKLQPGGRRAGWRLVTVEADRLVFDGPRPLVVQR